MSSSNFPPIHILKTLKSVSLILLNVSLVLLSVSLVLLSQSIVLNINVNLPAKTISVVPHINVVAGTKLYSVITIRKRM
jgi:hypothetical protein